MAKSVEEPVEDWAKKSMDDCDVGHFTEKMRRSIPTTIWAF